MACWGDEEEALLQQAVAAGQSGNVHNTNDWNNISERLSERGYKRSARACKERWKIIAPPQLEGKPFDAEERKILVEMVTRSLRLEEDRPSGPAFLPWSRLYEKISQRLQSCGHDRSAADCETFWRMIQDEEIEDTNHSFNMKDSERAYQNIPQTPSQSSSANMNPSGSAKSGWRPLLPSPETQQPKKKPRLGDIKYPSSMPTHKTPLRSLVNDGLSCSNIEVQELQQDVDSRLSNVETLEKSLRDIEKKRGRIQMDSEHELIKFTKQLEHMRDHLFGNIERERATIQQALETEKVEIDKAKAKMAYIKKSVDMLEGLNEHLQKESPILVEGLQASCIEEENV